MQADSITSVTPPLNLRLLPVPGWPGYHVSEDGEVWSECRTGPRRTSQNPRLVNRPEPPKVWRRLKTRVNWAGYVMFSVGRKTTGVHRLVLLAFIGPCPDGMEARHLDGNRSNNVLGNLKWGTKRENEDDKIAHGTVHVGERHPGVKLSEAEVREIRALYAGGGWTHKSLGSRFRVTESCVQRILKGRTWHHILPASEQTVPSEVN